MIKNLVIWFRSKAVQHNFFSYAIGYDGVKSDNVKTWCNFKWWYVYISTVWKVFVLEVFWSVFSRIRIEYGEILRMWENTDQKNSEYGHFSGDKNSPLPRKNFNNFSFWYLVKDSRSFGLPHFNLGSFWVTWITVKQYLIDKRLPTCY